MNILKVTFENGRSKIREISLTEEITDALQFGKKGRGKRKIFSLSRNMWIGTEVTIANRWNSIHKWKRQLYARRVVVQRKEKYTEL